MHLRCISIAHWCIGELHSSAVVWFSPVETRSVDRESCRLFESPVVSQQQHDLQPFKNTCQERGGELLALVHRPHSRG